MDTSRRDRAVRMKLGCAMVPVLLIGSCCVCSGIGRLVNRNPPAEQVAVAPQAEPKKRATVKPQPPAASAQKPVRTIEPPSAPPPTPDEIVWNDIATQMANEHDGRIVIGRWRNNTTMPTYHTATVYSKGDQFFVDHYFKTKEGKSRHPSTFALEERTHPAGRAFYKPESDSGDRYIVNENTKQLQIADNDGIILNCDPIEILKPQASQQIQFTQPKTPAPPPARDTSSPGRAEAIALATSFIRERVKRASFPFLGGVTGCEQIGDVWVVAGSVTGTNDFNARTSFRYLVSVKLRSEGGGELVSFKLREE